MTEHDFNRRARAAKADMLKEMAAEYEADPDAVARIEAHRAAMMAIPMDFILPICGVTAGEATRDQIVDQFCHASVGQLSAEQCAALTWRMSMLSRAQDRHLN
jgi:hypothetical protein